MMEINVGSRLYLKYRVGYLLKLYAKVLGCIVILPVTDTIDQLTLFKLGGSLLMLVNVDRLRFCESKQN